ncbi:thioredoxin-like protein, putative [Theileria annulata]|uniref:Thioredoxin-like protein, putative n=1 Tax=Theileria annulata TaxID=5874 RepID=Q4UH22_THEAN|nr:thioredoxin-like protein, putative [Theileria annulata]CAI73617.1 thioredoxin-like protein, putative [Theileria annulata]|eukprot:XP_954294.1 thioredoxin-like protein, putative [Theileria annulata]
MIYINSFFCLITLINVVHCRKNAENSEDSKIAKDSKINPINIEYFEYEFPINHHVIPFSYTFENLEEKNSVKSEESQNDTEDSSTENINNMNFGHTENPYTSYSFIRSHNISKSCPLDDNLFSNRISKFSRFGSGREQGYPDLNQEVIRSHYKSDKLRIHSVDVDQDKRHLEQFQITALPSLLLFVRGSLFKKLVGLVDVKTLIKEIDSSLDSL